MASSNLSWNVFWGAIFFVLIGSTEKDGDGVGGRRRCLGTAIFSETGLFLTDEIMSGHLL